MSLGGYTPSEDLVYTTIEITASILALHLACHYDLRCWVAISSLKRAVGWQPIEAKVKTLREKLFDGIVPFSLWFGQWSNIGYSNNPNMGRVLQGSFVFYYLMVYFAVVYKGLGTVLPLPRAVTIIPNDPSLSIRLLNCIRPPNHVRFCLALVLPPAILYSTYHGFRALHSIMAAGWVLGISGFFQPKKMVLKHRIIALNALVVVVLFLHGFDTQISSYMSYVFRGPEPELQPQWALRLWLSLCPVMPSVIAGLLIGPALRIDLSRAGESIPPPEYIQNIGVPVPRVLMAFPKHMYMMTMVSFIGSRFVNQFLYRGGHSRQLRDLSSVLSAVCSVSIIMACHARSGGYMKEWWEYREDWSCSSPPTSDQGEKERVGSTEQTPNAET